MNAFTAGSVSVALGRPRRASASSVACCEPFSRLAERVAAEIADLLDVLVRGRDVERLSVIVDAEKEHDLVARSLEVELQVRVLIRAAARTHGRLPVLDHAAVAVHRLAEALAPQLAEPVARRSQPLRVAHEHDDVDAGAGERPQRPRQRERRVREGRLRGAHALVHHGGAREQLVDVDPRHGRREQADRGERRESSVDVRRHDE